MKISRHQIIAFACAAQEKNFSKAAQRLKIGQSAITQHIAALEEVIGAKLFIRTRSGAQLTTVGGELFPLADQIYVLEEQFFEKVHQYKDLSEGHLSLCVSTSRPAMAIIAAFKRQFPGIHINLTVAPWRDALKLVQLREVDLAIAIKPEEMEQNLYCQDIEEQAFMAILPPQHPLRDCDTLRLNDLLTDTIVLLSESSYTRHCVDKLFKQLTISPHSTLTTSSYDMMFEAVTHGLGVSIALAHPSIKHKTSIANKIIAIPINELPEKHTYSVFCLKSKSSLRVIKNFIATAKNHTKMAIEIQPK